MLLASWEVCIGNNCDRGSIFKPEVTVFPCTDQLLGPVYMVGGLGCSGYPGRANFLNVSLKNALKRSHARQGSPPTWGTLSTCPGHPARRDGFLLCKRFMPRYPGLPRWDKPRIHGGARWNFSQLPLASVICLKEWRSVWRDKRHRRVSGGEQASALSESWNKMEKSFLGRPSRLLCLAAALTVPVRWVACKGGLCVNPSSQVAQLAGAPPCM